jgi:UDP-2,4-diacetamido-2,4,6-trideoxy-beta-L-altropyranose hydrolase
LGPCYALLRDEFRQLRKRVKPRTGPVRRILIFFGGVDADNYTGQTLDALGHLDTKHLHIDVVIGALHPCRSAIEMTCAEHGFICHVQTDRMAKLMASADLAIGAGGTATWERCCLGLPSLVVSLADNQTNITETLDLDGYAIYLGPTSKVNTDVIIERIRSLWRDLDQLEIISQRAFTLVDGMGTHRVVHEIGCRNENFNFMH